MQYNSVQSSTARIAVITDIHHGPNEETKVGDQAITLLKDVLVSVEEFKPDLLVDLGDRITDESYEADVRFAHDVAMVFGKTEFRRVHLLGNHDVWNIPVGAQEQILGASLDHQTIDLNGWHLIFWQADPKPRNGIREIPSRDLEWLERAVDRSTYPTVIFTHMPIAGGSYKGNYWFADNIQGSAEHTNAAEARKIVTESDSVVLVVAGHTHWNTLNTIDGVHFVTVQSLTESYTTYPDPAKAWTSMVLGEHISIDTYGNDPMSLQLRPRSRGFHALQRKKEREPAFDAGDNRNMRIPDEVSGILLDLDGVVYTGEQALPGVVQFLEEVRSRGIRILAITNHSGKEISAVASTLRRMRFELCESEIVNSAWASAEYLSTLHPHARVYVVGEPALENALADAGLTVARGSAEKVDYVVVGYCAELHRQRIDRAIGHILDGAQLIGTNPDRLLPTPDGPVFECGPLIAFLEFATRSRAYIVGKPSGIIMDLAVKLLNVPRNRIVMVGDNPETDIEAGIRSGIATVWVKHSHPNSISGLVSDRASSSLIVENLSDLASVLFRN